MTTPYEGLKEFEASNALREAICTRAQAEMLFGQVLDLLGDSAWVETWNGEQAKTVFRRESPDSKWIIPWPLLSIARGGREGPSPILTAVPGVYEEPNRRPGPAPKIRGLGPGQFTVCDGRDSITVCYGGDGRWFECSVSDPHRALAGVVAALATKSASPVELVAGYIAGLDAGRWGPGRVHLPVPLPGGAQGVWNCGLAAIRDALFRDQFPAGARWAAADGWTGRALAFGATRDEAVEAWRGELARLRPFPEKAPTTVPLPLPDQPTESSVEQEFDGQHLSIRVTMVGGPTSDAARVEPTLANSPVATVSIPEPPDQGTESGAWVRLLDAQGLCRLAILRRERNGFTLIGDALRGQDLSDLDSRLAAADREWDARPMPTFERPPGLPPPPPTDTSVRTYRIMDEKTRAPVRATVTSAARRAASDARGSGRGARPVPGRQGAA